MRAVRIACLLLALVAGAAALPGEARALDPPSASCNGGGCGGWFRSGVTVSWSFNGSGATGTSGCGSAGVSDDTTGVTFTCTVNYGGSFVGSSVTVKKDSTPPGVSGSPSRGPDSNGWYTRPVSFSFSGDDGTSGVGVVHRRGTYSGPDSGAAAAVTGIVHRQRGQHRVDVDDDQVRRDAAHRHSQALAREPDANGWYNHPVDVAFTGHRRGVRQSPSARRR